LYETNDLKPHLISVSGAVKAFANYNVCWVMWVPCSKVYHSDCSDTCQPPTYFAHDSAVIPLQYGEVNNSNCQAKERTGCKHLFLWSTPVSVL